MLLGGCHQNCKGYISTGGKNGLHALYQMSFNLCMTADLCSRHTNSTKTGNEVKIGPGKNELDTRGQDLTLATAQQESNKLATKTDKQILQEYYTKKGCLS